jgi:hypothetical protein
MMSSVWAHAALAKCIPLNGLSISGRDRRQEHAEVIMESLMRVLCKTIGSHCALGLVSGIASVLHVPALLIQA